MAEPSLTKFDPLNIRILNPDKYIPLHQCLEVTSHTIYEPSTQRLHPDGFFSEVIFGQQGTVDRLIRRGYIDLHTKVISPHLYKTLISLKKAVYTNLAAGKEYAYWDTKRQDFVPTTASDPNGRTGYSFFIEHIQDVVYEERDSNRRSDKIALMYKYKNDLFMDKLIVMSAGVRDLKEDHGRTSSEEVNKLYMSVLSLAKSIHPDAGDDPIYDGIRYQIQMKIVEIYDYIANMFDGKGGFAQSKYVRRSVAYSNRNVITSLLASKTDTPGDPDALKCNELLVPLFQGMKAGEPIVKHQLKIVFFDQIFNNQVTTIPLINPQTYKLEYYEVAPSIYKKYSTIDGMKDIIDNFRDLNVQYKPVTIPLEEGKTDTTECLLYLVYDDGKDLYIFRNIDDFKQLYTKSNTYSISNTNLTDILNTTAIPPTECIILGSMALGIYNLGYKVNSSIDLLVSDSLYKDIAASGNYSKNSDGVLVRNDGKVCIWNEVYFTDKDHTYESYKEKIVEVDGYRVLAPSELLVIYEQYAKFKDSKKPSQLRTIVLDTKHIRPLTYMEMCYIAASSALDGMPTSCTRYPILTMQGIAMFNIHMTSTTPSRIVRAHVSMDNIDDVKVYPNYPILDSTAAVKTSLSLHPSTNKQYDADFDGDVLGIHVLMSDESKTEVKNYFQSPISMIDAGGDLIYGTKHALNHEFVLFALSYHELSKQQ